MVYKQLFKMESYVLPAVSLRVILTDPLFNATLFDCRPSASSIKCFLGSKVSSKSIKPESSITMCEVQPLSTRNEHTFL